MTTHDALLPAVVLQRKAVVYVRQSTPQQVQLNLESQRRQYELVEVQTSRKLSKALLFPKAILRAEYEADRRFTEAMASKCEPLAARRRAKPKGAEER